MADLPPDTSEIYSPETSDDCRFGDWQSKIGICVWWAVLLGGGVAAFMWLAK